ncbi:hypothetical protein ACWJJH_14240 [Endozoicomonadaceae bacterium StTr2]
MALQPQSKPMQQVQRPGGGNAPARVGRIQAQGLPTVQRRGYAQQTRPARNPQMIQPMPTPDYQFSDFINQASSMFSQYKKVENRKSQLADMNVIGSKTPQFEGALQRKQQELISQGKFEQADWDSAFTSTFDEYFSIDDVNDPDMLQSLRQRAQGVANAAYEGELYKHETQQRVSTGRQLLSNTARYNDVEAFKTEASRLVDMHELSPDAGLSQSEVDELTYDLYRSNPRSSVYYEALQGNDRIDPTVREEAMVNHESILTSDTLTAIQDNITKGNLESGREILDVALQKGQITPQQYINFDSKLVDQNYRLRAQASVKNGLYSTGNLRMAMIASPEQQRAAQRGDSIAVGEKEGLKMLDDAYKMAESQRLADWTPGQPVPPITGFQQALLKNNKEIPSLKTSIAANLAGEDNPQQLQYLQLEVIPMVKAMGGLGYAKKYFSDDMYKQVMEYMTLSQYNPPATAWRKVKQGKAMQGMESKYNPSDAKKLLLNKNIKNDPAALSAYQNEFKRLVTRHNVDTRDAADRAEEMVLDAFAEIEINGKTKMILNGKPAVNDLMSSLIDMPRTSPGDVVTEFMEDRQELWRSVTGDTELMAYDIILGVDQTDDTMLTFTSPTGLILHSIPALYLSKLYHEKHPELIGTLASFEEAEEAARLAKKEQEATAMADWARGQQTAEETRMPTPEDFKKSRNIDQKAMNKRRTEAMQEFFQGRRQSNQ